MNEITEQQRSELQDNILSLAMGCPVEHCNPEDCPLFRIRQMDLPSRLEWFKSLTDEELIYLNAYHVICMKTKWEMQPAGQCC